MMNGPSTATNDKQGDFGGDNNPPTTAAAAASTGTTAPAAVIQQEPVNFNHSAATGNNNNSDVFSRRVTLGGNPIMDRRGSMGSLGGMMDAETLFAKRLSMGFGPAAAGGGFPSDLAFHRRGSMDSAGLDAALLDLTRRRLSMGGNAMGMDTNHNNNNSNNNNTALDNLLAAGSIEAALAQRRSSLDMIGASAQASTNALLHAGMDQADVNSFLQQQQQQQQQQAPGMLMNHMGSAANNMNMFPPGAGASSSMLHNPSAIAARQQQLQAQQRELERRQRELEQQRRELIASMQQRKHLMMQTGDSTNSQINDHNSLVASSGNANFLGGMGNLDSMQAAQSSAMLPFGGAGMGDVMGGAGNNLMNNHMGDPNISNTANSNNTSGKQQWWICQICNKQAFSSHEEALSHEAVCVMATGNNFAMGQQLAQQQLRNLQNTASGNKSVKSGKRGMDASVRTSSTTHSYQPVFHKGPFDKLPRPMSLAMSTDKDWLTPLHCFVRKHCVEIFSASENDVSTPSKGKRKPIQVGQIGIRCPHCHTDAAKERGSVYYPTTIASIYNATMNLLQRHLHSCNAVPKDIMEKYETLKSDDARSGTSKRYWIKSALSLGLVDTADMGIRYSAASPPPLPQLTDSQKDMQNASVEDELTQASNANDSQSSKSFLTEEDDRTYGTEFSYELLSQMKPCLFTEADRLGKRKGLPPGFPGLACKHCFGGYGSGRFFPSSIKTLSDTSKTLNVLHNHMIRCRKCPADIRERLEYLRATHDEERSKMKFGSQKAFFARTFVVLGRTIEPHTQHHILTNLFYFEFQAFGKDFMVTRRLPANLLRERAILPIICNQRSAK